MLHRAHTEIIRTVCPRSANLRRCQDRAGSDAWPNRQERHVLARMVGAGGGGIVAMVRGHDEQIILPQPRQQIFQPRIEALQVRGIAGSVVAVPVQRIEIDQVREDDAASTRRHFGGDGVDPSSSFS